MDADAETRGDAPQPRAVVPLFPLPNTFLFPGTCMPLHIFEPRYRQMVQDLLDGPGRLVMGTLLERAHPQSAAEPAQPSVLGLAGLGEILQHEGLPDGRYYIMITGLQRVRIREVPSTRLYRRVEVEPVAETPVATERADLVREKLTRAILQRCPELTALPCALPLSQLADLLLLRLQLPQCALEPLFCELDVERRCLGALAEHARRPIALGHSGPPPPPEATA